MAERIRLALHGRAFSGKSTLARTLVASHGFTLVDFTGDIKARAARALSAATGTRYTREHIEAHKEDFRPFLIALAAAIGVDEGETVPAVLVEQLGLVTDTWPQRVVLDNVRFPGQMDRLVPYGFRLVCLEVSEIAQYYRSGLRREQFDQLRASPTEQPLPFYHRQIVLDADQYAPAVVGQLLDAVR